MKILLDILIGWNQGRAERAEASAATARSREQRFRREYARRYPRHWTQH